MKRSIQIVLVLACSMPLLSSARDETLEERKQRITRKYLRERSNLVQSDIEVPGENAEDESVLQSETYKEMNESLNQDRTSASLPPPPPPPRMRNSKADRNWLLSTDDPNAPEEAGEDKSRQEDPWSVWEKDSETSRFGSDSYESTRSNGAKKKSIFGRSSEEKKVPYSSRYGLNTQVEGSSGEIKSFSANGNQSIFQQGKNQPIGGTSSLFGRQKDETSGIGTLDFSRSRTDKQDQNRLQTPFLKQSEQLFGRSNGQESGKVGGYTPYKSPYEIRRSQQEQQRQQQQWGGQTQSEQEYKRQDPYKQWKKRNPSQFDPAGDDSFVNEVMPNSGR